MSSGQKLRLLQLGHVPFWRLVYLVQTGQQDCGTFKQYLNASNAAFDGSHPGFKAWLDRCVEGTVGSRGCKPVL